MKRFLLIAAIAALCSLCTDVQASSLFGKVIDVNSGDVITIFNLNRPVRVKLLGVDAPEMGQAFGDVAKSHLAELVHEKSVLVEYFGIAGDGSLTGRVLLDNFDIGAQMIRDGAAWFDPNNVTHLSPADREIYHQSEQAARSEHRGLWQAENPMAPWESVKAEARKKTSHPSLQVKLPPPAPKVRENRPDAELTNLGLMPITNLPAKRYSRESEIRDAWAGLTSSAKKWQQMRPEGQNFSILVPDQGQQVSYPAPIGGEEVQVNMYLGRDGASVYTVMWITAPTIGETDKAAIEDTVSKGFIKPFHELYAKGDRREVSCAQRLESNVSMNGYTGREFDLSSCTLPTRARAFTRVVDNERQMIIAVVFYGDEDPNVPRFIKSFTVGSPQNPKPADSRKISYTKSTKR